MISKIREISWNEILFLNRQAATGMYEIPPHRKAQILKVEQIKNGFFYWHSPLLDLNDRQGRREMFWGGGAAWFVGYTQYGGEVNRTLRFVIEGRDPAKSYHIITNQPYDIKSPEKKGKNERLGSFSSYTYCNIGDGQSYYPMDTSIQRFSALPLGRWYFEQKLSTIAVIPAGKCTEGHLEIVSSGFGRDFAYRRMELYILEVQ